MHAPQENWTEIIKPQGSWFDLKMRELWRYRDLVQLFVWRDFIAQYKQTVLGPLWHFVVPLVSAFMYMLVFGGIMGVSTEGVPPILFFLSSISAWSFFSKCLLSTSTTFTANAHLFGKVYFPRLVTPVSTVISALLQFIIQLIPLIAAMGYYGIFTDTTLYLGPRLLLIIPLLVLSAMMSLGAGILLASLTTKYRDLSVFLNFGILLLMYISAVVYPVSQVPELYRPFVKYNPVVPLIEGFRYALIGAGSLKLEDLTYASIVALLLFIAGVIIFNRTERTFMDTV